MSQTCNIYQINNILSLLLIDIYDFCFFVFFFSQDILYYHEYHKMKHFNHNINKRISNILQNKSNSLMGIFNEIQRIRYIHFCTSFRAKHINDKTNKQIDYYIAIRIVQSRVINDSSPLNMCTLTILDIH